MAGYRGLDAYRLAEAFSAGSVGANIAEADGRWTDADRRRLPLIPRGSLQEIAHWLELAHARGLVDESFRPRIACVGQLLGGLIRSPNGRSGG